MKSDLAHSRVAAVLPTKTTHTCVEAKSSNESLVGSDVCFDLVDVIWIGWFELDWLVWDGLS